MIDIKWLVLASESFTIEKDNNPGKFGNFIEHPAELDQNIKLVVETLEEIDFLGNKNHIRNLIEYDNRFERLDSIGSYKLLIGAMKKFGFSQRFIIKEIFKGENLDNIDYTNSEGMKDVVASNPINDEEVTLFKARIGDTRNKVRIIIAIHHLVGITVTLPLLIDTQHNLYSKSNTINDGSDIQKVIYEKIKESL